MRNLTKVERAIVKHYRSLTKDQQDWMVYKFSQLAKVGKLGVKK